MGVIEGQLTRLISLSGTVRTETKLLQIRKVAQFEPENYSCFVAQFKPKQLAQFHRNGWHISNRNSQSSPRGLLSSFLKHLRPNARWQRILWYFRLFESFYIKFIILPFCRVVDDIFRNGMIGLFVSDDVFVIIALPQFTTKWLPSQIFHATDIFVGGHCFEPLHHPM